MKKAVQQIMLGTVTKNEKQTAETLRRIKAAGYDGIELNGFMVKPTSFLVRMLTKAAGMPVKQRPPRRGTGRNPRRPAGNATRPRPPRLLDPGLAG